MSTKNDTPRTPKKINRRSFSEIHGHNRKDETSEQTAKRLLTSRLKQLVRVSNSVGKLGKTPYKPSDTQRAYAIEIAQQSFEAITQAMTPTEKAGDRVEVPE